MNPLKLLIAIGLGTFLGTNIGFGVAWALALFNQWKNPGDPSAGSVLILAIFTAPLGFALGALIGAVVGWRWM